MSDIYQEFDQLKQDVKRLGDDVLRLTAELRARGGEYLAQASRSTNEAVQSAADVARRAGKEVDRMTHERAWTAVTISAIVGAVVAFLLSSRRKDS